MGYRMPDTEARRRRLQQALEVIVSRLGKTDVQRAILFGSFARGTIHTHSDLDLILIRDDPSPFLRRLERARAELHVPVALDLLVYTPEEFAEMVETNAFIRRAVREGRIVYEAGRASRGSSMVRAGEAGSG